MSKVAGFMVGAIASYLLIRRRQRQAADQKVRDELVHRIDKALDQIEGLLWKQIGGEVREVTMEERLTGRLSW